MISYLHENAKEFYFQGNGTGILLLHGFTGSPSEMRYLGEYLKDKGFSVKGVLLKGHGTTNKELKQTNHLDWIASCEQGYMELAKSCDEVFVVGFSMGGALALHLSQKYDVKGIICLATPIKLLNKQFYLARLYKHLGTVIKNQLKLVKQKDLFVVGYKPAPVKSIISFFQLIKIVKADLHKIEKPILIMQSYGDGTVNPSSANMIYNRIASTDKSIIFLHKSGHVITCDCEKEQVFEEVHHFLIKRCKQRNQNPFQDYSITMEV